MEGNMTAHTQITAAPGENEYVTIVAPTLGEVMKKFRDSGLAAQGYAIAGRVGRHRFAMGGTDAGEELFGGSAMTAATFFRPIG
jgi:hypothetical protein